MRTIYVLQAKGGWFWTPVESDAWYQNGRALREQYLREPFEAGWQVPQCEWLSEDEIPDVPGFRGMPCIWPGRNPALDHYFRDADQLPLGGAAHGWVALRYPRTVDIGFKPRQFLDDPSPQVVALESEAVPESFVGRPVGVSEPAVSIEDDSVVPIDGAPESCGLRAWCRQAGLSGLLFKKFWTEDHQTVFDPRWTMRAHFDASVLD